MHQFDIKAEVRKTAGTRDSRRLRLDGRLPVVLCGRGAESRSLHVSATDFEEARRKHARILMLQIDGATEAAVVHDVAYDPLTSLPVHLDLQRVNMNEKIVVEVPIKTKGPAKGEADGGILVLQMGVVKVRCMPRDIPDQLEVDIRPLAMHETIHVKQLTLPAGVEAADDATALVLAIVEPHAVVEAVPAAGAEAAPTEPELIGKPAKEGEEEGAAAEGAAPAKEPAKEKKPEKKKE